MNLPNISRFRNALILAFEPQTRNFIMGKQLARSKIDSKFKPLNSVCEFSIHPYLHTKFLIFPCKMLHSFHPNRPEGTGFSTIDKYQKPHVLVAKLFIIFTRTCSGSYAISWLECRQTNMFDAKTVILY